MENIVYYECTRLVDEYCKSDEVTEYVRRNVALNLNEEIQLRLNANDSVLSDYGVYYIDVYIHPLDTQINYIKIYGSSKMLSYEETGKYYHTDYAILWHILNFDDTVNINIKYLFEIWYYFELKDGLEHGIVLPGDIVIHGTNCFVDGYGGVMWLQN
jgi:hypothetical protein